VLRNGRESDFGSRGLCLLHQHAVMCAVLSAADRQIRAGAGREGQCGRDQRKAEEDEERDRYETSHTVIVAECLAEAELCECCWLFWQCTLCFCKAFAMEEMQLKALLAGQAPLHSSRCFTGRRKRYYFEWLGFRVDFACWRGWSSSLDFIYETKRIKNCLDYLSFDAAIAGPADVYLRALEIPTALVLGGR
jgi:hypothetical protein